MDAVAVVEDGAGAGGARRHANRTWAVWRRSTAGASGALVMVLEAAGCGRRAKVCLGRFILRTPWRRHPVPCHFPLACR